MNARPTLARSHAATSVAAALLSTALALGLLTAVTALFQSEGQPFEQVVIAEHACSDRVFVSERETCVRSYLAAAHLRNVASR